QAIFSIIYHLPMPCYDRDTVHSQSAQALRKLEIYTVIRKLMLVIQRKITHQKSRAPLLVSTAFRIFCMAHYLAAF
ncbi:hypothetical protein, partial [Lentibacillus salicampi]|uniref:hypothetical protein n=1 Tax=Lentibacillus salicampi TaxID=175306 RepID=UPI001ADDA3BF